MFTTNVIIQMSITYIVIHNLDSIYYFPFSYLVMPIIYEFVMELFHSAIITFC